MNVALIVVAFFFLAPKLMEIPDMVAYATVKDEITRNLHRMKVTANPKSLRATARRYIQDKQRYLDLEEATGVPPLVSMVIADRESGGDSRMSLAQGDRWDRVSIHVPKGRGPFRTWLDAAIDAVKIDGLNNIGKGNWTVELACFFQEKFNGFGYRLYGVPSAYVWAGTNVYQGGKFISDGKFSRTAWDTQIGVVPMMAALIAEDPSLALPFNDGTIPVNFTMPDDGPDRETKDLQIALNKLGANPKLSEDGDYGPKTKQAVRDFQKRSGILDDGKAGQVTWAKIEEFMKSASMVASNGN